LRDQHIWIAKLQAAPGKRDELIAAALTHAGNVHRTEEEALSFVVLERKDDDVSVVLFERYTSKEYFEQIHRPSASMKEYQGKVRVPSPMVVTTPPETVFLIGVLQIAPLLAARQSEGYTAMRGFIDKREAVA